MPRQTWRGKEISGWEGWGAWEDFREEEEQPPYSTHYCMFSVLQRQTDPPGRWLN